jgi:hypothetical protein
VSLLGNTDASSRLRPFRSQSTQSQIPFCTRSTSRSRSGLTLIASWRSVNVRDEKPSEAHAKPQNLVHRRNRHARAAGRPILRPPLCRFEQLSERRGNDRFRRELPPHPNLNELPIRFPNRVIREIVQSPRAARDRELPARIFPIPGNLGHSGSSLQHRTTKPHRFSHGEQNRSFPSISLSCHKDIHPSLLNIPRKTSKPRSNASTCSRPRPFKGRGLDDTQPRREAMSRSFTAERIRRLTNELSNGRNAEAR